MPTPLTVILNDGQRRYPGQAGSGGSGAFNSPPGNSTGAAFGGSLGGTNSHPWTSVVAYTLYRMGTIGTGRVLTPFATPQVVWTNSQTKTQVFTQFVGWNYPNLAASDTTITYPGGWSARFVNIGNAPLAELQEIYAGIQEPAGYYYQLERRSTETDTLGNVAGDYYYRPNATGSGTSGNAAVFYIVGLATVPVVSSPATVTSGGVTTSIPVSWTAATGLAPTNPYGLFRISSIGSIEVRTPIYQGSALTFTDTVNSATTLYGYEVEVYALNPANNQTFTTGYSNRSLTMITGGSGGGNDPTPPTVTACQACCRTKVKLAWNAIPGAVAYNIARDGGNGVAPGFMTTTMGLSYTDTGLSAGTTYTWMVTPVFAVGTGTPGSVTKTITGWRTPGRPTGNFSKPTPPTSNWKTGGCNCG